MSPAQRKRLIQGYYASFERADPWDFQLPGAGALKSTASDMLTYLDANLHPNKYSAGAAPASPMATLPAAVALQHESRADAQEGVKQALAWGINLATHSFGHKGGTYGYESIALFNPIHDGAIIALYNRWIEENPSFVDFLDHTTDNVSALLSGTPPPRLDILCEADKRRLAGLGMQ
jgi:CubicO group peptidase (beta-lactamase class C family)